METQDAGKLTTDWMIEKYHQEEEEPYEVNRFHGNQFLREGIENIWDIITGTAGLTDYDNANAGLGVGNGTAAATIEQTELQGASIKYKGMQSGYPVSAQGTVSFKAQFGTAEANFDWEEFSVSDTVGTTGTNINRKVSSQGTKASGSTWNLTAKLTIT